MYLSFSEIDDGVSRIVKPNFSWSKNETSWNSLMFPHKDASFWGKLSEPSFLFDVLRYLFGVTNLSYVVSTLRVDMIRC